MENTPPKLIRRRENYRSTMKSGRTIGEQREHLETASERASVHKKAKFKKRLRFVIAILVFAIVTGLVILAIIFAINNRKSSPNNTTDNTIIVPYTPTIEVIDEDAAATGGKISSRMQEYIGQAEADLRAYGITPTRAVLPTGTIREVNFYLEGHTGFIKMTIDRGSGVSAEDADRMLRYLQEIGVEDFTYIDVRLDGKAYWK